MNAEKTSQSFDRYECWRPAYELVSVGAWLLSFTWVTWLYFSHKLPLSWCAVLWTITLFLIGLRAYQAIRVLMARAALSGSQLTFINYEELAQIMKGHSEDLWLGVGFRWWPEHS